MGDYPPQFYLQALFDTPWKATNSIIRHLMIPVVRLKFALAGIPWGRGWMLYGLPILLKHRQTTISIGDRLNRLTGEPIGPGEILATIEELARHGHR